MIFCYVSYHHGAYFLMSGLIKRSMSLYGHRTSIALEKEFWFVLKKIAQQQDQSLATFIAQLDAQRPTEQSLASILRITALRFVAAPDTHIFLPNTYSDHF